MGIDDAVDALTPWAVDLLADLIRADSTIGHEASAQEVLATALTESGFAVERLEIPAAIAEDPVAGVPLVPYDGRYVLVARRPGTGAGAPSVLLNGHMDVVP